MKSSESSKLAQVVLVIIFFLVLSALSIMHMGPLFKGLNSKEGMEQAQIAREFSRGNGLVTKVIRPASLRQNQEVTNGKGTIDDACQNTYHAPLNPIILGGIFKLIFTVSGTDEFEDWRFTKGEYVYQLDRIVVGFSIVCLLLSIGVCYILAWRIFDPGIAGTVAVLMLLCELFWKVSMSGLPHMLMLLLFSLGCYFAYRAFEETEEKRGTLWFSVLAALFLSLLCLTHWLAVWIMLGYIVSAAIFIRPRGLAGVIAIIFLLITMVGPAINNYVVTGAVGGTAYLAVFEGIGGSEEIAMRNYEAVALNLRSTFSNTFRSTLAQANYLYLYLGAILAIPFFFGCLIHPFKKAAISNFRWAILLMWIFASVGMALFGISEEQISSNQLHMLFIPLMSAYGLAMITVQWSRLNLDEYGSYLNIVPHIIVILVSAGAFLIDFPKESFVQITNKTQTPPQYPPYAPSVLDESLIDFTGKSEIIASDQPWAVAWYTDRRSLWLPANLRDLEKIEEKANSENTPIVGVLMTPYANGMKPLTETNGFYFDYLGLLVDGWASVAAGVPAGSKPISSRVSTLSSFHTRYPKVKTLFFRSTPMIFYSARENDL